MISTNTPSVFVAETTHTRRFHVVSMSLQYGTHAVYVWCSYYMWRMSIKEVSNDVTDMFKVPRDDQSLRISMENLKLRDNQEEEYVSRNQYHLVRGRIDQLIDEEPSVGQADGAWNGMRSAEAQPDDT